MPIDPKKRISRESITTDAAYRKVIAALVESEERYRALVEGVRRYAIYMLDAQGIVQTWNKGIKEVLGYERDEIVGRSGSVVFTSEDRAMGAFQKQLAEAKKTGDSHQDRQAVRKDGSTFAANDVVTALHNSSGALLGFGKVTRELRATGAGAEDQLARALALLHVEVEHRRKLESSLLVAVEEERQRIGQDIHDDLCQHLAGVAIMARNLANRLEKTTPEESKPAHELSCFIEDATNVARNVSRGLHPLTLVSQGLPAALGELAERVPIDVDFKWPKTKRLDLEAAVALHVYRIAEEAVANAIRHSGAKKIWIRLAKFENDDLSLSIEDDGNGFDQNAKTQGVGLRNMKYRAGVLEGTLSVETKPNKGTCIRCLVPSPRLPPMN